MISLALTAIAAIYLFAMMLLLGATTPGYNPLRHTISELGEHGAPRERLVGYGVFLPVGLALLLVAYRVQPFGEPVSMLALCIAIGYVTAAVFPCDPGSPIAGSWRQQLHNLGGFFEYIVGGISLIRLAGQFGQPFRIAGFITVGVGLFISAAYLKPVRGLIQRIAEFCLFGGLALAIWRAA